MSPMLIDVNAVQLFLDLKAPRDVLTQTNPELLVQNFCDVTLGGLTGELQLNLQQKLILLCFPIYKSIVRDEGEEVDLLTEGPGWAVMHPLTKDPVLDVRTVGPD